MHPVASKDGFEGVEEESEEMKGIDYIGLIPILTKAIQEQQQMIANLEKRIAAIEG